MLAVDSIVKRLYLLPLSTTAIPLPTGILEMVTPCYLLQTTDGKNILIDSGLPPDYVSPANTPPAENVTNVIDQLALAGLQPTAIDTVICTHFDIDHAGCHDLFPGAEFVVQRAHYDLARSAHPRYAGGRAHWDNPMLHYRQVDGDTTLVPGVCLIETSGHAPSHQSVLVRLPKTGAVLLAIDAVVLQRLFTVERKAWPTDDNEGQLRASTQKLLDIVVQENVMLTVFGHDGKQWQSLKKAPEYYD